MTLNNILVLPGDNIGPEITSEAVKVINQVKQSFNLDVNVAFGVIAVSYTHLTLPTTPYV